MLFLIAPNLDPRYPDLMLVFTGPKMAPFWAPKDGTSGLTHQTARQINTSDPAFQMARLPARQITCRITHQIMVRDPTVR